MPSLDIVMADSESQRAARRIAHLGGHIARVRSMIARRRLGWWRGGSSERTQQMTDETDISGSLSTHAHALLE